MAKRWYNSRPMDIMCTAIGRQMCLKEGENCNNLAKIRCLKCGYSLCNAHKKTHLKEYHS